MYKLEGVILILKFMNLSYFNNTIENYLWFVGIFLMSFLIIQFLKAVIFKHIFKWAASRSVTAQLKLIPIVKKYLPRFLYVLAFYMSVNTLMISPYVHRIIMIGVLSAIVYIVAKLVIAFVEFMFSRYRERTDIDSSQNMAMTWLSKMVKAVIWIIAFLIIISNIVPDVSALVAGLGVGGIAVAFAAQAIIEDIFSYFTIFLDRPFQIGDFITTGDYLGEVKHIGIRTTRLKSLGGEELVFSNKDLTSARIRNYKTMEERRVVFSIGVTYDTSLEKLKQIPEVLKEIIDSKEMTRFDRAHFLSYGDSSLKYEIVYYVLSGDYNKYMDVHQAINFDIRERFDAMELEFAFPTRTLYIENNEPKTTVVDKNIPEGQNTKVDQPGE
jgi:Small-conductance mechanosensitive channel